MGSARGRKRRAAINANGVAIDLRLALDELPGRPLEVGERPDPAKTPVKKCPVSGKTTAVDVPTAQGEALPAITPETPAVEVGRQIIYLCDGGHFRQVVDDIFAAENAAEGATGGPAAATGSFPISGSTFSSGTRKMLYMRVNFPDRLAEPQTEAAAYANIRLLTDYFQEQSYGRLSFFGTVTPLLTLPRTEQWYIDDYNTTGSNGPIMNDAKEAARAAGYPPEDFQHFTIIYFGGPGSFGGLGNVNGPNAWLKTTSIGTFEHEIGHNLGVWHSNHWNTNGESVIGPGANVEYGNIKDVMGNSGSAGHFNASMKEQLQWIKSGKLSHGAAEWHLPALPARSGEPGPGAALFVESGEGRGPRLLAGVSAEVFDEPVVDERPVDQLEPLGGRQRRDNGTTLGSNLRHAGSRYDARHAGLAAKTRRW